MGWNGTVMGPRTDGISRRALLIGGAGAAAAAAAGAGFAMWYDAPVEPELAAIRIVTGGRRAVYFTYGMALGGALRADLPGTPVTVVETRASVENIQMIADGRADVGFAQADIMADDTQIAALARLYDEHMHLVVRSDSALTEVFQLAGRRVSIGADGSGTAVMAHRIFAAAGIDPDHSVETSQLDLSEATAALARGEIDAFLFAGGLPVSAIGELVATVRIKLIPLGGLVDAMRDRYGAVYVRRAIPVSTYGLPPVTTIATATYLVTAEVAQEALAYQVVKTLFGHREEMAQAHPTGLLLDRRAAIATFPMSLHPGAKRYYRESKA